mmetsp:Transcript_29693/g.49007  ORF Transcript_29693/g.49007 Transcript_29693/m.49007 type:complete len:377 (-) Transcript_29693:51-1181(-)|eukprot:CAMPEP_0119005162 /NCGR_PEP_ID=MMETSP1176-20130426/1554_1 /TAXON_ID=265551 /ORGANISM="Synedropsis recta cf, Strain CCMP1620" /LENGTH=376 /DNA_ID=CAMNT_0006956935 /DNA_START=151 /DNA_END=1281 /DNA_ORIENTATION=+
MGASVSKDDETRHPLYRAVKPYPLLSGLRVAQCDDAPPAPPPLPGVVDAAPPPPAAPDSIEAAAMFASSIPNPGPYEQAAAEGKRLVSLDTFDGMRFDISKQLSPYMAVVHSFWLGTTMIPDGRNKSYSFITQIADEAGLLFTRIDFDRGSVDGRVHRAILGGMAMGKLQLGVSQEGQNDQCLAEVDFGGQTWTGNLKYGAMGGGLMYGGNYFQSITSNLAMGGECMYLAANKSLMSNYTLKYRIAAKGGDEDEEATTADSPMGGEAPSSLLCVNYNGSQDALTFNYKRVVTPNRVSLGAELMCSPSNPGESQVLVGAEFKLTRSKVSIVVDGGMRIQSTVEAKLGMGGAPTIQFAGELDHLKNVLRFGYGLNIEG